MKKTIFIIIAIILITIILPLIIICNTSGFYIVPKNKTAEITNTETIKVYIKSKDVVEEMPVEDYIVGVVAAEVPASFETEAIKAQAVAARSYLMSHINSYRTKGIPENHKGADACTDYTHCQAWLSEAERKASWSSDAADENWEKIKNAVAATQGEVMRYDGEIINAVFHSTSSGKTENAVDVWGSDVPYLKSVNSEGDKKSPKYSSDVDISVDEYKNTIAANITGIDWTKGLYSDIVRSDAGGIVTMKVGGAEIKGSKLRSMFGIRSTNVELSEKDGRIYMRVLGYGHGVGMSQYGANYLAGEGKGYKEILKTYYTGVEIVKG